MSSFRAKTLQPGRFDVVPGVPRISATLAWLPLFRAFKAFLFLTIEQLLFRAWYVRWERILKHSYFFPTEKKELKIDKFLAVNLKYDRIKLISYEIFQIIV